MRNALVIVIVCLSVSLLYDVYKEPIDRLRIWIRQRRTKPQKPETGSRKRKNRHRSQTDSRKKVCRPLMMDA